MPPHPTADTQQSQILRTFTVLHSLREDWGGALIIACGLSPQGAALALASNIAGAVCLSIENDPAKVKDALRTGSCDFIVNTLDEALRAMKNEVRKHLPLSVGLQGNPTLILQELLERGVAPELFTDLTGNSAPQKAIQSFKSSGALIVRFDSTLPIGDEKSLDANATLNTFIHDRQWLLHSFPFDTQAALRAFDAHALTLLPEDDLLRRRWLQAAPKILQRERPIHRVLWVTEQEKQILEAGIWA
jgi:urocanate hydratase